jgi:hypothetical protein
MRILSATLVLGLLAAAPAAAEGLPKAMLARWTMDKAEVVKALPTFAGLPADKQKDMLEKLPQHMPDMDVEFTSARVLFSVGASQRQEGRYRVLGTENGVVRLEIRSKGPDDKASTDETSAELLPSGHLKLTKKGDPTVLLFRRKD